MNEMFRKYLLSSVAVMSPPGEGDPDAGDDRIPEPALDDDEASTDPEGETGDDDPEDGDDPDGEGDDVGDGEPGDEPERTSRGDRQVGALRAERRRLADENARITRELNELRSRPPTQQQPLQPQETPQQRADRLALMSPEERTTYLVEESLQRHTQQQNQVMGQLLDQADKTAFEGRCLNNPLLRKLAPQVETMHATLRSQGRPVDRDTVAKYLIGQKVLEQAGKAKPGARERARRERARPVSAGGDVQPQRRERRAGGGDTAADLEARFGDVQI